MLDALGGTPYNGRPARATHLTPTSPLRTQHTRSNAVHPLQRPPRYASQCACSSMHGTGSRRAATTARVTIPTTPAAPVRLNCPHNHRKGRHGAPYGPMMRVFHQLEGSSHSTCAESKAASGHPREGQCVAVDTVGTNVARSPAVKLSKSFTPGYGCTASRC